MYKDQYKEAARSLLISITQHDYFLDIFNHLLKNYFLIDDYSVINEKKLSCWLLNNIFEAFYDGLPDNSSIQREPFNKLCKFLQEETP